MRGKTTVGRARRVAASALFVGLSLGLSACDSSPSGPTAAEAGKQLSKDAKPLLDFLSTEANTHVAYTVSNDAVADKSCGDGKATRTFSAYARVPADPSTMPLYRDHVSGQSGLASAGYEMDTKGDNGTSRTRVAVTEVNRKSHTRITVDITPQGAQAINFHVIGHTDCLRSK